MADPRTYFTDTADPGQTDFSFNFDYLEDEHVTVSIDGAATTDFTIVTSPAKKIVLDTPATGGEIVRVQRISAPDENLVDFQNGSVLTESELDRAYLHNRYLAEESAEQNDISLRVKTGATGSFDALNKKIVNVSDPTADQDAATKNYVDDTVAGIVGGSIPDDSVTYAKLQNATGNNVLLGNDNGADSDIQELNATEAKTLLGLSTVATSGSYNDLSDKPSIGTGTVVSIASGTGLTGGPITTSGTISLAPIANLRALGNVSGGSAAPTAVEIKDEDNMVSDSATALATQQSIKAYVDSQIISKYTTGWSTSIPTAYSNVTYTHNLGTEDVQYKVYVRDSSGNEHDVTGGEVWGGVSNSGCLCVNITSTQITIRFFKEYLDWTTATASANPTQRAWSTATNIKVVVIG